MISGVRESDPRTRLGKPVHYHCANTASTEKRLPQKREEWKSFALTK